MEKDQGPPNVIDAYIKRSRLSRFEKFQESYWKEQFLKENGGQVEETKEKPAQLQKNLEEWENSSEYKEKLK